MFDLNDKKEFNTGTSVFNNGVAGLVKNVDITVERKGENDHPNSPDYKVIVSDDKGSINKGFYYPTKNERKTDEDNERLAKMHVNRVITIARALVGDDYELPEIEEKEDVYKASKEAFDKLFALIKEKSKDAKVNVYATYGTVSNPERYMTLRFFDFIESADKESSTLFVKGSDLMKRIEPDNNSGNTNSSEDMADWTS